MSFEQPHKTAGRQGRRTLALLGVFILSVGAFVLTGGEARAQHLHTVTIDEAATGPATEAPAGNSSPNETPSTGKTPVEPAAPESSGTEPVPPADPASEPAPQLTTEPVAQSAPPGATPAPEPYPVPLVDPAPEPDEPESAPPASEPEASGTASEPEPASEPPVPQPAPEQDPLPTPVEPVPDPGFAPEPVPESVLLETQPLLPDESLLSHTEEAPASEAPASGAPASYGVSDAVEEGSLPLSSLGDAMSSAVETVESAAADVLDTLTGWSLFRSEAEDEGSSIGTTLAGLLSGGEAARAPVSEGASEPGFSSTGSENPSENSTPQPFSPLALPPVGSSFSPSLGGELSSGGATPLLLCVLVSCLILPRLISWLARALYEPPRPISALLAPLERPG